MLFTFVLSPQQQVELLKMYIPLVILQHRHILIWAHWDIWMMTMTTTAPISTIITLSRTSHLYKGWFLPCQQFFGSILKAAAQVNWLQAALVR